MIEDFIAEFPTNLNLKTLWEQQRQNNPSCCRISFCRNPTKMINDWNIEVAYYNHLIKIIQQPSKARKSIINDLHDECESVLSDINERKVEEKKQINDIIERLVVKVEKTSIIDVTALKQKIKCLNNNRSLYHKIDAMVTRYKQLIILTKNLQMVAQTNEENAIAKMLASSITLKHLLKYTDSSLLLLDKVVSEQLAKSAKRLEALAVDQRPSPGTRDLFKGEEALYKKRMKNINNVNNEQGLLKEIVRLSLMTRSQQWLLPVSGVDKETQTSNFELFDKVWEMCNNSLSLRFDQSFQFYKIMSSIEKDSQVFFNDIFNELVEAYRFKNNKMSLRDIYIALICRMNRQLFAQVKGPSITVKSIIREIKNNIERSIQASGFAATNSINQSKEIIDEMNVRANHQKNFLEPMDFTTNFSVIENALKNAVGVKEIITSGCYGAMQEAISQVCSHDFGLMKINMEDDYSSIANFDMTKVTINSLLRHELRQALFKKLIDIVEEANYSTFKIAAYVTESQYYLRFSKDYLFYDLLCQLTSQVNAEQFEPCHQRIVNIISAIFHLASKVHFSLTKEEDIQLNFIKRLLHWKVSRVEFEKLLSEKKAEYRAITKISTIFCKEPFTSLLFFQTGITSDEIPSCIVRTCIKPLVIKGMQDFAFYVETEGLLLDKPNVELLREYMSVMTCYLGYDNDADVDILLKQMLKGKEALIKSFQSGIPPSEQETKLFSAYTNLFLPKNLVESQSIHAETALKLQYVGIYLYRDYYKQVYETIRRVLDNFNVNNCFYFARLLANIGFRLEDTVTKTSPFYLYMVKVIDFCFYGDETHPALISNEKFHEEFSSEICSDRNSFRAILDYCLKKHPSRFVEVQQLIDIMLDNYCERFKKSVVIPPAVFYLLEGYASLSVRKYWRSKIFNIIVRERANNTMRNFVKCMKKNNRHGPSFKNFISPNCLSVLTRAIKADYNELIGYLRDKNKQVCIDLLDLKYIFLVDILFPGKMSDAYRLDLFKLILETACTFSDPHEIELAYKATNAFISALTYEDGPALLVWNTESLHKKIEASANLAIDRNASVWNQNIALLIKTYLPNSSQETNYFLLALKSILRKGKLVAATHFIQTLKEKVGYGEDALKKVFERITLAFESYFINEHLPGIPQQQRVGRLEYYLVNLLGLSKTAWQALNYRRLMDIFQILPPEQQINQFIRQDQFIEEKLYQITMTAPAETNQEIICEGDFGLCKEDFQASTFLSRIAELLTKEVINTNSVASCLLREPEVEKGKVIKKGFGWITVMPSHIKKLYDDQVKESNKKKMQEEREQRIIKINKAYERRDAFSLLKWRSHYLQEANKSKYGEFGKKYYCELSEQATILLNINVIFYLCSYKLAKAGEITQYDLTKILDAYTIQLTKDEARTAYQEMVKKEYILPFNIEARVWACLAADLKGEGKKLTINSLPEILREKTSQLLDKKSGLGKSSPINAYYENHRARCDQISSKERLNYLSCVMQYKKQLKITSYDNTEDDLAILYLDQILSKKFELYVRKEISQDKLAVKKSIINQKLSNPKEPQYEETLKKMIAFWKKKLEDFFDAYKNINSSKNTQERFSEKWQLFSSYIIAARDQDTLNPDTLHGLKDEISKFVSEYRQYLDKTQIESYFRFGNILDKEIPGIRMLLTDAVSQILCLNNNDQRIKEVESECKQMTR